MIRKSIFCLMAVLALATLCVAADLPGYDAKIAGKIPGMKLSIDCVIQQPVEEPVLKELAEKVYNENGGKDFKNVFIMWYLPHYKIGSGAWATTNFNDGKMNMSVLKLQD